MRDRWLVCAPFFAWLLDKRFSTPSRRCSSLFSGRVCPGGGGGVPFPWFASGLCRFPFFGGGPPKLSTAVDRSRQGRAGRAQARYSDLDRVGRQGHEPHIQISTGYGGEGASHRFKDHQYPPYTYNIVAPSSLPPTCFTQPCCRWPSALSGS